MKLALIIGALGVGGAERVLATLANYWSGAGHEVTLITTFWQEEQDSHNLADNIKRVRFRDQNMSMPRSLQGQWIRLRFLRETIRALNPDYVISFLDYVNIQTLLATCFLDVPVIVSERTDPFVHRVKLYLAILRRILYPGATAVLAQTEEVRRGMSMWWPRIHVEAIPNPLPPELLKLPVPPLPSDIGERRKIVAIGRLDQPKGMDLLLKAFAPLAPEFPEWDLWIWGEGALRQTLISQRNNLGLVGRAHFPGVTQSPWEEISKATVFVLPSQYEGFPNALSEAMALGRPCVAFDCRSGPREISCGGKDAMLVPAGDTVELGAALKRMIRDANLRNEFAVRATSVRDRYSVSGIGEQWNDLFERIRKSRINGQPVNLHG